MSMSLGTSGTTPLQSRPANATPPTPQEAAELGRRLHLAGRHHEAIEVFDAAIRRQPAVAIPMLALAYDCFSAMPQNRYRLYVERYFDFAIAEGDRVLDIGSGHDPFPFATHLADRSLTDDHLGRAGAAFDRTAGLPTFECDVEDMACFGDAEFDFVHCSHVLEHTTDPGRACRELMRVGRRGYIETPTRGKDLFLDTAAISHHRWAVENVHGVLTFVEYTPDDVAGLGCDVLMKMHCAPQSVREKAFAALVLMRAHLVNTMLCWDGSFEWEVKRRDGSSETSRTTQVAIPAHTDVLARVAALARGKVAVDERPTAANPNTIAFYDELYAGKYVMGALSLDWTYEAEDRVAWYRRVAALPFFDTTGKFLDVGCGLGGLFASLPPKERNLFGIDFSPVAIERTRERLKGHFTVGRAEALPYPTDYFDRICCTEALEHVDDPDAVLASMASRLAPGGKLLITVPEETLDLHDHEWPGGVSLHINSFSIASLAQAVAAVGLRVESAVIDEREIWLIADKPG